MPDRRKLRITVAEVEGDKWEITVSSGAGVIEASGPLGQLTAMGRLDDYLEALTRFVLHGTMPATQAPEKGAQERERATP